MLVVLVFTLQLCSLLATGGRSSARSGRNCPRLPAPGGNNGRLRGKGRERKGRGEGREGRKEGGKAKRERDGGREEGRGKKRSVLSLSGS